jgi:hypothetical protein
MLLPIVFILAFLMALTGALLENGAHTARVAYDAGVGAYADVGLADGVADFTHALAAYIAVNGSAGPWPEPSPSAPRSACAAGAPAACPFAWIVSATITGAARAGSAGGTDALSNAQTAAIDEGRISANVTVTIVDAAGNAVGTRSRLLTYRVFAAPPYAVISGARDSTAIDGSRHAAQGDSGGAVATGGGDDTRIHAQLTCKTVTPDVVPFTNDQQPAGNDGLPWGNAPQAAYEIPCSTDATPADAFADERWTNGDAGASGWTP